MSGGAYDYKSFKVREFAEEMELQKDYRRVVFQRLLKLVSKACYAIEWEDSGDTSMEKTHEAIDSVFDFLKKFGGSDVLSILAECDLIMSCSENEYDPLKIY